MSSTSKPTGYLLNGPADWDAFERRYILKIGGERVAHLGLLKDPAEFHKKRKPESVIPEISNYKKAKLVTDQQNQSTFVRGDEPAAHYSDFHPDRGCSGCKASSGSHAASPQSRNMHHALPRQATH
jgi:hypothetical protein